MLLSFVWRAASNAAANSSSSAVQQLPACIRAVALLQQQQQHIGQMPEHHSRLESHSFASTSSSTSSDDGVGAGESPTQPAAAEASGLQLKPKPQLVDQLLSPTNMNRRQQLDQRKPAIIQEFQRAPGDTGSPEVQIALLTERIRDMTAHIVVHRKDHVSKRGLQGMLNQRRKLLSYLRRDNFSRYAFVIHKLGLKDTYAKQERYDKYRVGTRLGAPAELLKRYGSH